MKTGAASSEKAFYEARLTAYDAQLTLHEAALRTIKRSLFRLHVFLPKIWAKKWGASYCFRTSNLPEKVQISFLQIEITAKHSRSDFSPE